jgi:hypothetical protein
MQIKFAPRSLTDKFRARQCEKPFIENPKTTGWMLQKFAKFTPQIGHDRGMGETDTHPPAP